MFTHPRNTAITLLILIMLAGCGKSEPAETTTGESALPTTVETRDSEGASAPTEGISGITPQPSATPAPQISPSIKPPGEELIVFYSERDGDAEIYLMKPDGSEQTALTDNDADDYSPAWSPDGRLIVFESDRDDPKPRTCFPNCDYNLYVMNADGSDQRRLTALPGAEWNAEWSPDGCGVECR